MSDTLSSLSTETLTAAVKSLLQGPLPDAAYSPTTTGQSVTETRTKVKQKKEKQPKLRKKSSTKSKQAPLTVHCQALENELLNKTQTFEKTLQAHSESASSKNDAKNNAQKEESRMSQRKQVVERKKKVSEQQTKNGSVTSIKASSVVDTGQKQITSGVTCDTLRKLLKRPKSSDGDKNMAFVHGQINEVNNITAKPSAEIQGALPVASTSTANNLFVHANSSVHMLSAREATVSSAASVIIPVSPSVSNSTGKTTAFVTAGMLVPSSSYCTLSSMARGNTSNSMRSTTAVTTLSHNSSVSDIGLIPASGTETYRDIVQHATLQTCGFSTPDVPQPMTDGVVPMLSLGPGLNIPLAVRPANTHLVSALLSRLPTILPKPDMIKPIPCPPQSQHVSIATTSCLDVESKQNQYVTVTRLSHMIPEPQHNQHLVNASSQHVTTAVSTPPLTSPAIGQISSSPVPAQYLNEIINTPCVSNPLLGDPTGMEIQSLMNIVYGHLMEKDRSGRTPTPGTMMLDSSFPHLSAPYQTVTPASQPNSQSDTSMQGGSSGPVKVMSDRYTCSTIGTNNQQYTDTVTLETQQEHTLDQQVVDDSRRGGAYYQPAIQAVDNTSAKVFQAGIAHQPQVNITHLPHLNQSTIKLDQLSHQPFLALNQQQPSEFCHQSVISHTERLQHPPQTESYQYNGPSSGSSTCMYMQNSMGHVERHADSQGLYQQISRSEDSAAMESYTTPDTSLILYNTSQNKDSEPEYTAAKLSQATQQSSKLSDKNKMQEPPATESQVSEEVTYCLDCNKQLKKQCQIHNTDYSYIMDSPTISDCLDCNKQLKKQCLIHNTDYSYILDSPVLSRARASLPTCFYLKDTETAVYNSLGVWCKEAVSIRLKFGPVIGPCRIELRGEVDKENLHFNPYKVFERDKATCYEMTDENLCNWMMFIQLATNLRNQNCVLYQQGRELYILTKKDIKKDAELLMWFSSDICLRLKVSEDPSVCRLVQCTTCGQYFVSKKLLHSHRKMNHPSEAKESWKCWLCEKSYSSRAKLNSHTMVHMGVKPHRCIYCNKEFTDHSNLKVHQYIHTGQKKYKCTMCNRTFRQKAHLNSHLITHTGEKNVKCKYCDKVFARQSDCKVHEYSHTKEKMYSCEVCRKVFYKLQLYKRHQKVHTGERNYMCNKCFKGFHTKYHRDRHLNICKEKGGKELTYMSLEEVANLDNTCDAVPLTVKAHEVAAENQNSSENCHHFQNNAFDT